MNTRGSMMIGGSKKLLAEEVFQHIAAQIVDGVLAAGQRIRDIDVAEQLHVSRTPVREALQRLERLGLVMMYPSRYTEVTEVTPELVAHTLEFAGYHFGIAARMSAPRMASVERTHAADLVDGMIESLDDGVRTSDARWAVFSYLSDRSHNEHHRIVVREARVALFRNLRGWVVPDDDRGRMRQVYADFRQAVLDGDGEASERHARTMHYV